MRKVSTEVLADGLTFPEGPRWRDGKLWFSDFYTYGVYSLSLEGVLERQLEVANRPSGLGWTPEGKLLVVSMMDRKLLQWDGDKLTELADLSGLAAGHCNDMLVCPDGTAFVGHFGYDLFGGEAFREASLIRVRPGAEPELAADAMAFPNGAVLCDQGRTLVVAETFTKQLTAFNLGADASLSERRVWADLGGRLPDGICLDAEGGIWVAAPGTGLIRVEEGGKISHELSLSQDCYACAISDDGNSLLVCTSAHTAAADCEHYRSGRIERVDLKAL